MAGNFFGLLQEIALQQLLIVGIAAERAFAANRFALRVGGYLGVIDAGGELQQTMAEFAHSVQQRISREFFYIAQQFNAHNFELLKSLFADPGHFLYGKRLSTVVIMGKRSLTGYLNT